LQICKNGCVETSDESASLRVRRSGKKDKCWELVGVREFAKMEKWLSVETFQMDLCKKGYKSISL